MNDRDYEEVRGERDAAALSRVAAALDVSGERAPRPEFIARLRADLDRERHERAVPRRARPSLRWAAWSAIAGVLAVLAAVAFPMPSQGLDRGILIASKSGFVTYDPTSLQERARVNVAAPKPWAVLAPDGVTLVFTFERYNRLMRVLDIRDPNGFRDVPGLRNPDQFALTKNGSKAYVRDGDGIRIVDVSKASVIGTIPTPGVEDSPVYMAPDDRRLLQFTPAGELIVFDVEVGREMRRVKVDLTDTPGLSASARLAFSPDGSRVYAVGPLGSAGGPIGVLVLDTKTLEVIARASIDPDSGPSLSHERDPLAELDAAIASLGFVAEAKEFGTVTQIALSPDGRTLYAARGPAGNGIVMIDAQKLQVIGRLQSTRGVYALQVSPDGSRVFAVAAAAGPFASTQLLAVDSRSYGLVATAPIRGSAADDVALLYTP